MDKTDQALAIINPLGHVEELIDVFEADGKEVSFGRLSLGELGRLNKRYPILERMLTGQKVSPGEYRDSMDVELMSAVVALSVAKYHDVMDHAPSLAAISKSVGDMATYEREVAYVSIMTHSFPAIRKAFREALELAEAGANQTESGQDNRAGRRATQAKSRKSASSKRSVNSPATSNTADGTTTRKASPRRKSGTNTANGSPPATDH